MRKMICLFTLFSGLLFSRTTVSANLLTRSEVDVSKANLEIAERLLKVMGSCANRVWPLYSWDDLNVVLIGSEHIEAQTALSVKQNRIFEIKSSDLPSAALKTAFSFFEAKDGKKWMSINTARDVRERPHFSYSDIVRDNVRFAIHEGFHRLGQLGWKIYEGNRGTPIPILPEPRLYRSMLFERLREALLRPERTNEELQKARYWYDKWHEGYPEEVASTTDGYEGSARYVDWVGFALSEHGCSASEEKIEGYINSILTSHFGLSVSADIFAFDFEGYEVGALASFLLRRVDISEKWQPRLTNGETPLSILMEEVSSRAEAAPDKKTAKFNESAEKFQRQAHELVGASLSLLNKPDSILVSVPRNWYEGSFSPLNFYIDRATKLQLTPMAIPMHFEGESSSFDSGIGAVFLSGLSSPCGNEGDWQFVISGPSVEKDQSEYLRLTGVAHSGFLKGRSYKAVDGRFWFCAGAQ